MDPQTPNPDRKWLKGRENLATSQRRYPAAERQKSALLARCRSQKLPRRAPENVQVRLAAPLHGARKHNGQGVCRNVIVICRDLLVFVFVITVEVSSMAVSRLFEA